MSDNNEENNKIQPPPFSGHAMPDNISLSMDDGGEEVTRRIGGTPSFNPSFNPSFTSTTIAPPSFSSSLQNSVFNADPGASFDTTVRKGEAQSAPRSSLKFRWMLNEAPTLPEFHPLERTAVFVPNTSPSNVSARISDVLRDRSIEASYDDDKAKASCVTANGVDFRIRLYRGKAQYSHGIIVEVQRRFGTSISFYSDIKAILDAAEGKTPAAPQKNDSLPKAEEDSYKPNASSSLNMVSKMMSHSGYDAQYLAMQTLTSLTDPSKVGVVTARSIAEELLLPGNQVGHRLAGMILEGTQERDDQFGLRSMSLIVLANVLGSVSGHIPDSLRLQLVPVLRHKLRNAESNPRQAHIAAKCVEHLIGADIGDDLMEALEVAAQVGSAKHAGLESQAELCLQKIGSR